MMEINTQRELHNFKKFFLENGLWENVNVFSFPNFRPKKYFSIKFIMFFFKHFEEISYERTCSNDGMKGKRERSLGLCCIFLFHNQLPINHYIGILKRLRSVKLSVQKCGIEAR